MMMKMIERPRCHVDGWTVGHSLARSFACRRRTRPPACGSFAQCEWETLIGTATHSDAACSPQWITALQGPD